MTKTNGDPVLVTGGHGFLGGHLVDLLIEQGYRVRCLLRPERDPDVFGGRDVEIVRGDLRAEDGLAAAVAGAALVLHAAGLVAARSPGRFLDVNAWGTERLARAVAEHAPACRRFVLVSSQAAAGPSPDGRPIDESHPARPISHYGRSKLVAERLLKASIGAVPFTILRPPAIYGPGDEAILPFFQMAARGFAPGLEGRAAQGRRFNLLHAKDVAGAILAAAEAPAAAGRTYFLADDDGGYDYPRLKAELERVYGRRLRRVPLPDLLLDAAGVLVDECAALVGANPVFGRQKARELKARWWLSSARRAQADFGWRPAVALADGFRETAAWYAAEGKVCAPSGEPSSL